jgi:Tol biopolymer transport system component
MYTQEKVQASCLWRSLFALLISLVLASASQAQLDNTKIAFVSNRDGNSDIYLMNPDGTNPVNITNHPAYDGQPSWSPDGKKIAFVSDRDGNQEIYVMNACDGTNQVRLTFSSPLMAYDPDWSPDGTKIVFTLGDQDDNQQIYVMNADGTGAHDISLPPGVIDFRPSWSPDGTQIAFQSYPPNAVWKMNADGTNRISLSPEDRGGPKWHPCTKILFSGGTPGQIYVMDADGSNITQLTDAPGDNGAGGWSPDCTKIVFLSTRDGNYEVYVMNADGTNQENLTNNPANDSSPSWSPFLSSITVTKENDYGGGSVAPGSSNVRFLRLGVQTDSGTATISSVKTKFTGSSSAVNADISAFDLYYDANGNGELDDGAPLQTVSNPDLTNGATASGLSFSVETSPKYLLLVLDIAGGANPSHNAGLELTNQTFITSSNAGVASANFPIQNSMDTSLPVQLSSFSAASTAKGVTLNWRTETEVNNVGFNVYRSTTREGNYAKIGFVDGHGSTAFSHDYSFDDRTAEADQTYFYLIESIDVEGNKERSDTISIIFNPPAQRPMPTRFALHQNFPNPFNPETWIPFQLPRDADVTIEIYNLNGQIVRTLLLGKVPAGYYDERSNAAFWDGRSDSGEKVASGVYFYRLKAGDYSAVKRMVVVK